MNVNLQRFTRTWSSGTAVMAEGGDEEVDKEDDLGEK